MKLMLIAIASVLLLNCNNNTGITTRNQIESQGKDTVDTALFNYHFKILDSAAKLNFPDTIYACCTASIKFMEVTTRINSQSDGTSFGKLSFSKNDLQKWHEWYNKNNLK